jgi:hypothetical protein
MFDLRTWLRRSPKPSKLRIKTTEGEERIVTLGPGRTKWEALEETVRTADAASVECLDESGNILRAQRLTEEERDAEDDDDGRGKHALKSLRGERAELANVLDRYGAGMKDAFRAGSEAASMGQAQLVEIVTNLAEHLTIAITNVHTLSSNISTLIQAHADREAKLQAALAAAGSGDVDNAQLLQGFLGMMMGGGPRPPQTTPTNGKGKP